MFFFFFLVLLEEGPMNPNLQKLLNIFPFIFYIFITWTCQFKLSYIIIENYTIYVPVGIPAIDAS